MNGSPAEEFDGVHCPKCGGETGTGYGLAGGGCGIYTFCLNDDCDFFDKEQDPPEDEPAP